MDTYYRRIVRRLTVQPSGCLTLDTSINREGYATVWTGSGTQVVHRFMYERLVGPIPVGMTLDHLCYQRNCANVLHLDPVPTSVNTKRAADRRTGCRNGHPYTTETLAIYDGERVCRICARERNRKYEQSRAS